MRTKLLVDASKVHSKVIAGHIFDAIELIEFLQDMNEIKRKIVQNPFRVVCGELRVDEHP